MKKILFALIILLGEALIISCFIIYRGTLPAEIVSLNIVVSTIIFMQWIFNFFPPLINLNDKSGSKASGLGLMWYTSTIYTVAAIVAMVVCNTSYPMSFTAQLLIQLGLLLVLILGIFSAVHAIDNTKRVYASQQTMQSGVAQMRQSMEKLHEAAFEHEISDKNKDAIDALYKSIRYVSPCGTKEAAALENKFNDEADDLISRITLSYPTSEEVSQALSRMSFILDNRKKCVK